MAFDPTRNVSLTAELNPFIRARIASGRHRDVGEGKLRLLYGPERRNQRKEAALVSAQARG